MRLGLRILDSNSSLNSLQYLNQLQLNPGESATLLLQLVDLNSVSDSNQRGTRYVPASGATLTAKMTSINDANTLTKGMTQPFAQDPSIWQCTLLPSETQNLAGINIDLTLVEGLNIKIARGFNVLIMNPQSPYQC